MKFLDEFKKFIMRGNVIDMAVGLVIGSAFTGIVTALVEQIFNPIIGAIMKGGMNFKDIQITLNGDAKIGIGILINAIIQFLIVGFCLFLVVKLMNAIHQKKVEAPPEPSASEKLLIEIRDLLKKQQS